MSQDYTGGNQNRPWWAPYMNSILLVSALPWQGPL